MKQELKTQRPNGFIIQLSKKVKNKKLLAIFFVAILAIFFVLVVLLLMFLFGDNKEKIVADEKIYTVREVANLVSSNSNYFKNKTILLKGYNTGSTDGLGCSDYFVLIDEGDISQYKQLYKLYSKKGITEEKQIELINQIKKIPNILTGETAKMNKNIFPTTFAIYRGQFSDNISKNCTTENERFIIENKVQELNEKTLEDISIKSGKDIIPDDYISVILKENNINYVKSNGTIKILFSQLATVSFSIEKVNSPNKEFSNSPLSFVPYINKITSPIDNNNKNVYGKYGDYFYELRAPEIPGNYEILFSEPDLMSQKIKDVANKYEIIVIGGVTSELSAIKIVDRTIFAKLKEENPTNWKIISSEIKSNDKNWDVTLQIHFNSCGIDWETSKCIAKDIKGRYLVEKSNGLVREIDL